MSYVHCSYCGKRGHNRLGCPERHRAAAADPDGYIGRQIKREKAMRAAAVAKRVCSYCGQPGHNRRGCAELKSDRRMIYKAQEKYLRHFDDLASRVGFGPGTLIKVPYGDSSDPFKKTVLALIDSINWKAIDFLNHDSILSRHYQFQRRTLATARVVATSGWEDESSNWYNPPQQNSTIPISFGSLLSAIPELMPNRSDGFEADKLQVELVGPVKNMVSFPPPYALVTDHINSRFNLEPSKRADDWEKCRLPKEDPTWKLVYPEWL